MTTSNRSTVPSTTAHPLLKALGAISVVLNVVLLIVIFQRHGQAAPGAALDDAGKSTVFRASPPAEQPAESRASTPSVDMMRQPEELAKRLRELGLGPASIHAVLTTQARDEFAAEREALFRRKGVPFWRRKSPPVELREEIKRLEAERDKALAAAEVVAGGVSEEEKLERLARFGPIDPAKHAQLRRIVADYQQMAQEDIRRAKDPQELRAALQLIEQNRLADLKALLSPSELEEFNLRNSESSERLGAALNEVNVEETEFRSLMALQERYDATNRPGPGSNPIAAHEQAVAGYFDASRSLLGEERFKKVFSNYDAAFRNYVEYVDARSSLKPAVVYDLYALEREMRARHVAIQGMPQEQAKRETAAVVAQINERLNQILGPDVAKEFSSSSKAGVLKLLLTRAVPPPR